MFNSTFYYSLLQKLNSGQLLELSVWTDQYQSIVLNCYVRNLFLKAWLSCSAKIISSSCLQYAYYNNLSTVFNINRQNLQNKQNQGKVRLFNQHFCIDVADSQAVICQKSIQNSKVGYSHLELHNFQRQVNLLFEIQLRQLQILHMSIFNSKRSPTSGSINFASFDPYPQKQPQSKPLVQQKPKKGLHLAFNPNSSGLQQQKSSPFGLLNKSTLEQIADSKQQMSPVDLLSKSTPQQTADPKQQMQIKRVSSHVVVEENQKENLLLQTSDNPLDFRQIIEPQELMKIEEEEEKKVQQLFIQLIQQNARSFSQALKLTKSTAQSLQNIKSFFALSQLLKKCEDSYQNSMNVTRPLGQQKFQQDYPFQLNYADLEAQVQKLIVWALKHNAKNICFKQFSELFGQILTNSIHIYTEKLISENKFQKALAAANLVDKTFISQPMRQARTFYNAQLNCLIGKELSYLKKSSWLLQLGLVAKVFKPKNIFQYGKEIYDRYISFSEQIFPSQFLLLGLKCSQLCHRNNLTQQSVDAQSKEAEIIDLIVKNSINSSYVELWLLFIFLKQNRHLYQSIFQQNLKQLLQKVHSPKTFFEIIKFSGIQPNKFNKFLKVYQLQNKFYNYKTENKQSLKYIISELSKKKNDVTALKLKQWVLFSDLQQQYEQQRQGQFLKRLIRDFQILSNSDLVDFQKVLLMARETITDFRLNCNYKEHKRSQFYHILIQLQSKLKQTDYQDLLNLTKGCKVLLQLKQGIFCLNDAQKLKKLYYLNQYLVNQTKNLKPSNNNKIRRADLEKFLDYIQKTLLKLLETTSGQLYLRQQSIEIKKQNITFNNQSNNFNFSDDSRVLSFSLLTKILNNNIKIIAKMVLLTKFR